MSRYSSIALTIGMLIVSTAPGAAHHGAAVYDLATTRTMDAVVTSFSWINPHGLIEFDVQNPGGALQHWTAETASLTMLVRAGWLKTTLEPGARITISGHPAHNGSPTMILERVVLPNGRALTNFVPRS